MQEMQETMGSICELGGFLEEEIATHFSILAWNIQRSLVAYSQWGYEESDDSRKESHD